MKQKKQIIDIEKSFGKEPPQAVDLEEAVLGAVMLEKPAILEVVDKLKVEHFYKPSHQAIYSAILDLFKEAAPIDMRTVVTRLGKNGKLQDAGGALSVATIVSKVSSAANIEYHCRLIMEFALKRNLIEMAADVYDSAYQETTDVFSLLDKTGTSLQHIYDQLINSKSEMTVKEFAFEVLKGLQARMAGHASGMETGFEAYDRATSGLTKTDLIILAARPGMGKSALALQVGKQVAERGHPVGVFSLEMSGIQLIERLACAEAEIDSDKIKKGQGFVNEYEFIRYSDALGRIAKLPIHIDDSAFLTIVDLRARAIRMKNKFGIQLLIVDYLQLIKGTISNSNMNREQEISLISRTLKGIAKELDITIICLSQLSREVEKRGGLKRPQLSDLRESGSIEQDADMVLFLYRPEYYGITVDQDNMSTHGLCEVIIAKYRNGSTGTVNMKFIGKYTKFMKWYSDETASYAARQIKGASHYKNPTEELKNSKDDEDSPF
jgi:replicative DNA helicase